MILGPVSLIDCLAYALFLAPQLLIQAGLFPTLLVLLRALPFLFFQLPIQFVRGRYLARTPLRTPRLRGATVFEDIAVRCVRYGFRSIPARVGRVFFSRQVALPFLRWRMVRHGITACPIHWSEREFVEGSVVTKGVWLRCDPVQEPDIVIYYVHGGGFSMGSCYFYMEFFFAWLQLLQDAGYRNPAIFALEYSLVPDEVYPTQLLQTLVGYRHVLKAAGDASRVCVAGDSAGATLVLSLLLELGARIRTQQMHAYKPGLHGRFAQEFPPAYAMPRMAALISPWVTLVSNLHCPSGVDYIDRGALWRYGCEYAADTLSHRELSSPGMCRSAELWKLASPQRGLFITYGSEEVLSPDIEDLVHRLDQAKVEVEARRFDGGIHAWPIASVFLASTSPKRLYGLRTIVGEIRKRIDRAPARGKHKRRLLSD
ncbi:Monoterpene epsilon-lactone hydrolase [Escovopsis weberi]|uniref:Monoterpene epsilon-lactone hydrolase n=1 Tax=Escovopsis weberi TaxID=150374 RepID=A0A0M8N481_ESCWE|nr:Monoterpene epsilon-lactone hydrolase [Escovopsis weberi]